MRVAFKVKHGVDHMFKHPRPGQGAFLGDVADQHDARRAGPGSCAVVGAGFGKAGQVGRALAHLRDRTRCRSQLFGIHGLNRIDDGNVRTQRGERGQDLLEGGFGEYLDLRVALPEPTRAQRHLRATFLAGYIQGILSSALQ